MQVASLLAAAAVLAAAFQARGSFLMSQASGDLATSVRSEVKRAGALGEDVRYLYGAEAPRAFHVAVAAVLASSFSMESDHHTGPAESGLLLESVVQSDIQRYGTLYAVLANEERYGLGGGGFDVGKRLAEVRQEHPELVALDPEEDVRRAEEASHQGVWQVLATFPMAVAFLLGAMARPFPRYRRGVLLSGAVIVTLGALFGSLVWGGLLG